MPEGEHLAVAAYLAAVIIGQQQLRFAGFAGAE